MHQKAIIQLKTHNVSMLVVHLIHETTGMIKSLQYIYNKDLIRYIKILFKINNNPQTMMVHLYN